MDNFMLPIFLGILFLGFIIVFTMGIFVLNNRKAIGARTFSYFLLAASCWSLNYFLEVLPQLSEWKIILFKINYLWIALVPILFLQFSMEYTGYFKKRRGLVHFIMLILLISVLTIVWTDSIHGWTFTNMDMIDKNGLVLLSFTRGPLHFFIDISLLGLICVSIFFFILKMRTSSKEEITHFLIIISGILFPVLGIFLEILQIGIFRYLDSAPFFIIFSGMIMAFGLGKYDLLYIETMSRDKMVDSISEGIISIGPQGVVIDVNKKACEIMDTDQKDILGLELKDFNNEIALKLDGVEDRDFEVILNDRIYDLRVSYIANKWGGNRGILLRLQDITKRKIAETDLLKKKIELGEMNEALNVINKILRHDLLNNLTSIQMGKDTYLQTGNSAILHGLEDPICRSISLIGKMRELELSLKDRKEPLPVSLNHIIREEASRSRIDLTIDGSGSVLGDEAIGSVFHNLISNAVKHGKASEMKVSIHDLGDSYEVIMKDNGTGINERSRDQIFKEGYSYGEGKGSGLGLYIVKKVLSRYGGTIDLLSSDENGTSFVLRFRKIENATSISSS